MRICCARWSLRDENVTILCVSHRSQRFSHPRINPAPLSCVAEVQRGVFTVLLPRRRRCTAQSVHGSSDTIRGGTACTLVRRTRHLCFFLFQCCRRHHMQACGLRPATPCGNAAARDRGQDPDKDTAHGQVPAQAKPVLPRVRSAAIAAAPPRLRAHPRLHPPALCLPSTTQAPSRDRAAALL